MAEAGRTPGATGAGYKPEVGDIVLIEKRGHGMIASNGRPFGSRVDRRLVAMRYIPTADSACLHNCVFDLDEMTLVIPIPEAAGG